LSFNILPYSRSSQKNCEEWENKKVDANGKKLKRKQKTLETRRSLAGGRQKKLTGSDDEDDYRPAKAAAAKKKAPESKPAPKPKASTSNSIIKDEDDEDVKPLVRKKAAAPAAKAPKLEDFEGVDVAGPPRATKKRKNYVDDSETDDVKPDIKAKGKGKGRAAIADSESEAEVVPRAKKPIKTAVKRKS
jgi:DNA topoisomerase II